MASRSTRNRKRKQSDRIRLEQIAGLGKSASDNSNSHSALQIPLPNSPEEFRFNQLFKNIEEWALEEEFEPQSFDDFKTMERWKVTRSRKTIFILPFECVRSTRVSNVKVNQSPQQLNSFVEFTSAYFSLPVKVMDPCKIVVGKQLKCCFSDGEEFRLKGNKNEFGAIRLNVRLILDAMEEVVPSSAYCVLGITTCDIYEFDETENIIMGRGTGDRVGVLSLYRFDPSLIQTEFENSPKKVFAKKSKNWVIDACKTLAHETMHMFGLDHCTYFICVMNANVDPHGGGKDPIHLCPICLKKLYYSIKFNIDDRYANLLNIYKKYEWRKEVEWLEDRINLLKPG